ncbi:MAG: hypothetical protein QW100_04365 [Thermoplasmatales archaeon]
MMGPSYYDFLERVFDELGVESRVDTKEVLAYFRSLRDVTGRYSSPYTATNWESWKECKEIFERDGRCPH